MKPAFPCLPRFWPLHHLWLLPRHLTHCCRSGFRLLLFFIPDAASEFRHPCFLPPDKCLHLQLLSSALTYLKYSSALKLQLGSAHSASNLFCFPLYVHTAYISTKLTLGAVPCTCPMASCFLPMFIITSAQNLHPYHFFVFKPTVLYSPAHNLFHHFFPNLINQK